MLCKYTWQEKFIFQKEGNLRCHLWFSSSQKLTNLAFSYLEVRHYTSCPVFLDHKDFHSDFHLFFSIVQEVKILCSNYSNLILLIYWLYIAFWWVVSKSISKCNKKSNFYPYFYVRIIIILIKNLSHLALSIWHLKEKTTNIQLHIILYKSR